MEERFLPGVNIDIPEGPYRAALRMFLGRLGADEWARRILLDHADYLRCGRGIVLATTSETDVNDAGQCRTGRDGLILRSASIFIFSSVLDGHDANVVIGTIAHEFGHLECNWLQPVFDPRRHTTAQREAFANRYAAIWGFRDEVLASGEALGDVTPTFPPDWSPAAARDPYLRFRECVRHGRRS